MKLNGELRFATVPAALKQAETGVGEVLDLSAVSRADSAGIALLLELQRRAQAQGRTLRIDGASQQLRGLVRFFGLENILQLS
ncbi:MAG TPA: STAS domain-containing protein [Stenotrophobium sp.]|nr:STAS domain-containing protein [Stenotrophobium sp.]